MERHRHTPTLRRKGGPQSLEYPELGMEAVYKIDVVDFPAFVLVDDKGNAFFAQLPVIG